MSIATLSRMTLTEAKGILASIGYRKDWEFEQLRDAVPPGMVGRVVVALRVVAAAAEAELEARGVTR